MLSVVIEVLKKSVVLLCPPFANRCWYTASGLCITLHGVHPIQIHLIGIRDSPDHRSVRGQFTIWGRDLVLRSPY